MTEGTQVAVAPKAPLKGGGGVLAIIPQDIDQVWRLAGMAVMGKMAPSSLVKDKDFSEAQSACAIAIMAGAELGLTPLMALRSYAVINGRPSLWGDGLKAVVRQSGKCAYIRTGSDQTMGWCEAKRSDTGEEKRVEFTLEQAKRANLTTKTGPWKEGYADVMMERRATNRCLNDLFADVLGGIVDAQEALDDGPLAEQQMIAPPPPPPADEDEGEGEGHVIDQPSFRESDFLDEINNTLADAKTEDDVEVAFDELDVQSKLTGDEDALNEAFKIKASHTLRVTTPPADDGEDETT